MSQDSWRNEGFRRHREFSGGERRSAVNMMVKEAQSRGAKRSNRIDLIPNTDTKGWLDGAAHLICCVSIER